MKLKKVFLILLSSFLVGCSGPSSGSSGHIPTTTEIVNSGDMWYLPVNKDGLPEANIESIFQEIARWQEQHQDLEIIDVDYLYMQNTYSSYTRNYTYGVSLLTKEK